jgi:hypothetical protein
VSAANKLQTFMLMNSSHTFCSWQAPQHTKQSWQIDKFFLRAGGKNKTFSTGRENVVLRENMCV